VVLISLSGCQKSSQNNDAVRQGVLEYLATKGMTPASMEINVTAVKFDGNQADATVAFAAKGDAAALMTMQYRLEMKDGKWGVVGKKDAGQHGAGAQLPAGGAMPANPHGAGGAMPLPEDLPPSGKKK
jgi:hypothetical protein